MDKSLSGREAKIDLPIIAFAHCDRAIPSIAKP
jgi:hypothetical protein